MNFKESIEQYTKTLALYDRGVEDGELDAARQYFGRYPSIAILERLLSEYKAARDKIETDDIPALFAEYGFRNAELDDGTRISMSTYYTVKQGDKIALVKWLSDHGMDSIVKDSLDFPKGTLDAALLETLKEGGYDYTRESTIHPQTLKAAIKRHLEDGGERPPESAAIIDIFERAKIERKKEN